MTYSPDAFVLIVNEVGNGARGQGAYVSWFV